jgi:autotransporter-associated beta strand protein
LGGATLSGPITRTLRGTNAINTSTQAFVSGSISGAANFVKSGSQKLTLTGTNNYSGTTTISNVRYKSATAAPPERSARGFVNNNGSLIFNRSDSFTVANTITGVGSLTKNGERAMTMSGCERLYGQHHCNGRNFAGERALSPD